MNKKRRMIEGGDKIIKELKEAQAIRKADIDLDLPKPIGIHRLLNKIPDYPEWKKIKEKLISEPRKQELDF